LAPAALQSSGARGLRPGAKKSLEKYPLTEYRNPQNDQGSQQRMMVTLLLFFLAIVAVQYFLPKPKPQPEPDKTATPAQTQIAPSSPAGATAAVPPATAKRQAPAAKAPVKQAASETETVLENDYYRVVFTNRGGVAKSWVLKKFTDANGKPLDLVNAGAVSELGYPLSLFSYDKDLQKKLNEAMYVASATGPQPSVTFEFSDGDTTARKTFRYDHGYVLGMEIEVTNKGQAVQAFPQWPAGLGDLSSAAQYANAKIDWMRDGNIEHKGAVSGWFLTGRKWIVGGETFTGPFQWAAAADQYFAAAFLPDSPKETAVVTLNSLLEVPKDASKPEGEKTKVNVLGIAVGSVKGRTRQRVFAGPKTVDVLESTQAQAGGPDLRGMTDFGFFGFIAKPLFLWLRWTYEHMFPGEWGWGWSIAFLTVVITVVLLPLRISGMKSSLKMQKLQPQIKALNEKYKRYSFTDPRRAEMQKEMSELYKREGVNPVGGCLPLLLQMPFLIAFYSMLGNAIELRHAGWLWIKDLSAPDPLHILPIIIVVAMFFSQKSMPQGGMDPTQQKMMNIVGPLMIGYMSWFFAAGLCVYWAISNILMYVQQIFINRSELGRQVRKGVERRATRKK
jgi:YidC/Oxa1 family membrane protein insertase